MTLPAPSVAVMLPAFGDSVLLREAVASVLAQSSSDWTLTVFDDGRADPALASWFGQLATAGKAVRYVSNPVCLGINRNFQQCVDEAVGDLVVVLGADDRMLPNYVATMQRAAVDNADCAWFHPRVRVIDGTGQPVRPLADRLKSLVALPAPQRGSGEPVAVTLLRGNWMYFPSIAFRVAAIREVGFRPGYQIVQDLDLYLRLLLAGHAVGLLDEECFEYRRHSESLSSRQRATGERFAEEQDYFSQISIMMAQAGWQRAAHAARCHVMSRLHALLLAARAAMAGRWGLVSSLVGHAARPTRERAAHDFPA